MLDVEADTFQPWSMVFQNNCFCLCFAFCIGLCQLGAIDISPSKIPGGENQPVPNRKEGAPSLLSQPFKWIFGSGHSVAMERVNAPPNFKVEFITVPKQYVPSKENPLKVKMVVINQGEEKYILEFASAQHYELIIQDKEGKEVFRSSADKIYSQVTSSVVLNRNEKLVYEEVIEESAQAALNLKAGEYKLIGQVTARTPISAEASFQVAP
jgi:hypothetical protein